MNNLVRISLYSTVGFLSTLNIAGVNAMSFGSNNVSTNIRGTNDTADIAVQNLIGTLATFLTILAVVYALYGGFNILTAGGEEDKVKKGKTILIQALIGLVVIWLAYSIVSWLVTLVLAPNATA